MPLLLEVWAAPSAVAFIVCLTVTWYGQVLREVPNPYLVRINIIDMFVVLTGC